jgi:hypothetical protein
MDETTPARVESEGDHEHEWRFVDRKGTDTHWVVTVGCASCDARRTAPVAAAGIARNAIDRLIDQMHRATAYNDQ